MRKQKINIIFITSIIFTILILISIWQLFIDENDPCAEITVNQLGCYIQLVKDTGDIKYCARNYDTQECLTAVESLFTENDKELVKNLCEEVSDSSKRNECIIYLSYKFKDVTFCEVNYDTLDCLKSIDPQYESDKEIVKELCEKVTDYSKRTDCLSYVEMNY